MGKRPRRCSEKIYYYCMSLGNLSLGIKKEKYDGSVKLNIHHVCVSSNFKKGVHQFFMMTPNYDLMQWQS